MNIEQCEEYRKRVIEGGMDWVNGEHTIDIEELTILAEHYNLNIPKCFYNFVNSKNPDAFSATGAFKTIAKFLVKLAKAIKEEK